MKDSEFKLVIPGDVLVDDFCNIYTVKEVVSQNKHKDGMYRIVFFDTKDCSRSLEYDKSTESDYLYSWRDCIMEIKDKRVCNCISDCVNWLESYIPNYKNTIVSFDGDTGLTVGKRLLGFVGGSNELLKALNIVYGDTWTGYLFPNNTGKYEDFNKGILFGVGDPSNGINYYDFINFRCGYLFADSWKDYLSIEKVVSGVPIKVSKKERNILERLLICVHDVDSKNISFVCRALNKAKFLGITSWVGKFVCDRYFLLESTGGVQLKFTFF